MTDEEIDEIARRIRWRSINESIGIASRQKAGLRRPRMKIPSRYWFPLIWLGLWTPVGIAIGMLHIGLVVPLVIFVLMIASRISVDWQEKKDDRQSS